MSSKSKVRLSWECKAIGPDASRITLLPNIFRTSALHLLAKIRLGSLAWLLAMEWDGTGKQRMRSWGTSGVASCVSAKILVTFAPVS